MRLPLFIVGLVAAVTAPAHGADLREIEVERVDGNYLLHSVVWFDAGIQTV